MTTWDDVEAASAAWQEAGKAWTRALEIRFPGREDYGALKFAPEATEGVQLAGLCEAQGAAYDGYLKTLAAYRRERGLP